MKIASTLSCLNNPIDASQAVNTASYFSQAVIHSPVGKLSAIVSKRGLWALTFPEDAMMIQTKLKKYYPQFTFCSDFQSNLDKTKEWLAHYFTKNFSQLLLPPIDWQGSPFAVAAWKNLLKIPVGTTQSYGELAKKIGNVKASRAIGRIMGKNPIVIMVPCHRIIGANQTLTGYGGGLQRKAWLLKHEGYLLKG